MEANVTGKSSKGLKRSSGTIATVVWLNDRRPHAVPRRYAQSVLGQSDSQRTFPLDSRSISIASDSAQERVRYATLRRCPEDVPQRAAKADRSANVIDFQKVRNVMSGEYHHSVTGKATPNGQFTNWCLPTDNGPMLNTAAETRRANLKRLIERDYAGNNSAIARIHDPVNPKPNYFSDLLRKDGNKSFGEKAARKIEERVGLKAGQLDIQDSPLTFDDSRRNRLAEELRSAIHDLDRDEQTEALVTIRRIQAKRRKRA